MPNGLKPNISYNSKEQHNSVYTNTDGAFKRGSHTVTISISVVIASAVLLLCALLFYREVMRRRRMSQVSEEKARRESIRQSVRLKLHQLERLTESDPFSKQDGNKTPLVTFGDVITISPRQSPIIQARNNNHPRHENEYHVLNQSRANMGGKRPVSHIPPRPTSGRLSYRRQEQIRQLQRHHNGHQIQEYRRYKLPNTHNHLCYKLKVISFKHKGLETWRHVRYQAQAHEQHT